MTLISVPYSAVMCAGQEIVNLLFGYENEADVEAAALVYFQQPKGRRCDRAEIWYKQNGKLHWHKTVLNPDRNGGPCDPRYNKEATG